MATTLRADVVTLENLKASIDKAVALAEKRHGAELDSETTIINWEIFGRKLKSMQSASASSRLDVASSVVSAMKLKGPRPVVVGLDKWVLVGFWDPRIRDRLGGPL